MRINIYFFFIIHISSLFDVHAVCYVNPPKSSFTYLLYSNSMFQAVSLYYLWFLYDRKKTRSKLHT